jgi:hypothetical protein
MRPLHYTLLCNNSTNPKLPAMTQPEITEGQESLEQLPNLPKLKDLTIEYREKREHASGYHDNRLVQFLTQHPLIKAITLIVSLCH